MILLSPKQKFQLVIINDFSISISSKKLHTSQWFPAWQFPLLQSGFVSHSNGEWVSIESLPSKYPWGSIEVVNNRLLYMGGGNLATSTSNRVFIHNEETGWHLSNMEIQVSRSRHVSSVVSASDISQNYPGTFFALVHCF